MSWFDWFLLIAICSLLGYALFEKLFKNTVKVKYTGVINQFFETGCEGTMWVFEKDGLSGYDALEFIDKGDHLKVFDEDGITILFEGEIIPDYQIGWTEYPKEFKNPGQGQPSALGYWIHWTQQGWNPDDWAKLFFHEMWRAGNQKPLRAELIKATPKEQAVPDTATVDGKDYGDMAWLFDNTPTPPDPDISTWEEFMKLDLTGWSANFGCHGGDMEQIDGTIAQVYREGDSIKMKLVNAVMTPELEEERAEKGITARFDEIIVELNTKWMPIIRNRLIILQSGLDHLPGWDLGSGLDVGTLEKRQTVPAGQ